MESKLDELLASFKELKDTQAANEQKMSDKLEQLERDVHAGQDVAAERVVKKLKRDRGLEFKKKGHEKQFLFNDEIKDRMESAASSVAKVNSSSAQDRAALEEAKKKLEEGIQAISQRQKLIRLADRSEFGWDAVNEYEKDELAEDDDDAKRLEKAEKAAEQKAFKKRRAASRGGSRGRSKRANALPPMQQFPPPPPAGAMQPSSSLGFTQPRGTNYRPAKIPGPCFHCLKMGHLKANCPELAKPYPFVVSDDISSDSNKHSETSSACSGVDLGKEGTLEGVNMWALGPYQQGMSGNDSVPTPETCSMDPSEGGGVLEEQPSGIRFWEVEQGATQIQDVQGRLKMNLTFWKDVLKASQPVLEWISEGYKLPLLSAPPPHSQPNQRSAISEPDFVSAAVKELLESRCIHKVNERPHICSPLSVVTNAEGKKRLVV